MEAASAHSSRELRGLLKSPFRRLARVRKVRSGDPGLPQPVSVRVTSVQKSAFPNPAPGRPPQWVWPPLKTPPLVRSRGDGGAGQGDGRGEGTGKKGQGRCARARVWRLGGGAPVRAQEGSQPGRPLSGSTGGAVKSPASGAPAASESRRPRGAPRTLRGWGRGAGRVRAPSRRRGGGGVAPLAPPPAPGRVISKRWWIAWRTVKQTPDA